MGPAFRPEGGVRRVCTGYTVPAGTRATGRVEGCSSVSHDITRMEAYPLNTHWPADTPSPMLVHDKLRVHHHVRVEALLHRTQVCGFFKVGAVLL